MKNISLHWLQGIFETVPKHHTFDYIYVKGFNESRTMFRGGYKGGGGAALGPVLNSIHRGLKEGGPDPCPLDPHL